MKIFIKIAGLIGVFFISFFGTKLLNKKNKNTTRTKKETSINFDIKEHDFANLKKDIPASKYFTYTNTGDHPLKIRNIDSRCGCTIPEWSRKELQPGEKDSILVKYDSKKKGYFSKGIYIISNSDTSPDVLYIKGIVSDK